MVDLESLYFIKHIKNKFDSFMQTSVIRAEASKHNIDFRENYTMSTSEAQLKKADLILLIGANLRAENPVLNSLLRKHALHNDDVKIFSIGTSSNLTYFCKHLGTTLYVFKQLMEGKHKLSSFLLKAKNPIILVGTSFLNRLDLQHFDNLIYVLKKYLPKLTVNFLNSHSSIISSNEVGLNTIFNRNEDLSNVDLQVSYALNVVCDNMVNAVKV